MNDAHDNAQDDKARLLKQRQPEHGLRVVIEFVGLSPEEGRSLLADMLEAAGSEQVLWLEDEGSKVNAEVKYVEEVE